MSNYIARTRHKPTGEVADAVWLNNFYGPRQYGVEFPKAGIVPERECESAEEPNRFWTDRISEVEDCE